jgi:hypothetical protein
MTELERIAELEAQVEHLKVAARGPSAPMGFDSFACRSVLSEVLLERHSQHLKWGRQDLPCVPEADELARIAPMLADEARQLCEDAMAEGRLTFAHIESEEYAEVIHAPSVAERRAELVQLAAVIVQHIEAIDRRGKRGK